MICYKIEMLLCYLWSNIAVIILQLQSTACRNHIYEDCEAVAFNKERGIA